MKASVEITIIPIGAGTSISGYIADCCRILGQAGLDPQINPHGTSVEGDWDRVFAALRECHEVLHGEQVPRVFSTVKINTRSDREQTPEDKVKSVEEKLGQGV